MNTVLFDKFLDSIFTESESYSKEFFYRWHRAVGEFYSSSLEMEDDEIVRFLRKHPVDMAVVCKECKDLEPEVFAIRHWTTHIVPVTEEEGFRILDDERPLREKESALDESKDDFCINAHFGLGMWIRNNWIYRPDSDDVVVKERYDKCISMLTGLKPDDPLFFFPADSLSDEFLGKYYDHLKEFVRSAEPVEEFRHMPAKCPHCGRKVLPILYGSPGPEMMEAEERGEIILGGCLLTDSIPDCACPCCGQSFRVTD